MFPLAFLAFLSLFVCVHKIRDLKASALLNPQALVSWRAWIQAGKAGEFSKEKVEKALLHQMMTRIFPLLPLDTNLLHEKIRENFELHKIQLEKKIYLLEISTNISPLLGLLGTAIGMFHVFMGLAEENVLVQTLSIGISEALITTIVGLSIAIPSFIAHSIFTKKIEFILSSLEVQFNELVFDFQNQFTLSKNQESLSTSNL